MSAHFDGGAEIAGRRLREVEVTYVDDPTLDMGAEDSDDCPASPPPTYYLRVREEKRKKGKRSSSSGGDTAQVGCTKGTGGLVVWVFFPFSHTGECSPTLFVQAPVVCVAVLDFFFFFTSCVSFSQLRPTHVIFSSKHRFGRKHKGRVGIILITIRSLYINPRCCMP